MSTLYFGKSLHWLFPLTFLFFPLYAIPKLFKHAVNSISVSFEERKELIPELMPERIAL
jgi:hypothetical protein